MTSQPTVERSTTAASARPESSAWMALAWVSSCSTCACGSALATSLALVLLPLALVDAVQPSPSLGTRNGVQVGLQVILYAWATVACSLLLIPVAGMGLVYTVSAVVFAIAVANGMLLIDRVRTLEGRAGQAQTGRCGQSNPVRVLVCQRSLENVG